MKRFDACVKAESLGVTFTRGNVRGGLFQGFPF